MVVQYASCGRGGGEGPIKRVMGRRAQATDTAPSPRAAARTTGGRRPAPARTRTGPGRDAAARSPRRRRLMTSPGRARARPARPGLAAGPGVNASPPGLLSRRGPGGSPGGGDSCLQARVHLGTETNLEPIRAWFSACHTENHTVYHRIYKTSQGGRFRAR